MRNAIKITALVCGFLAALALALFWLYVAIESFPWIVPADHNSTYVNAYDNVTTGSLLMAGVSLATMLFAAGCLGTGAWGWITALFLWVFTVISFPIVYPQLDGLQLNPHRLLAHGVGLATVAALAFLHADWQGSV
ncbi:MAG: hypothetical protein AB7K24_01940 [Gemmataceae bacterium]